MQAAANNLTNWNDRFRFRIVGHQKHDNGNNINLFSIYTKNQNKNKDGSN